LGVEQSSLNGIDFDRDRHVIYTVNQRAGELFRITVEPDGSAGDTAQVMRVSDGLDQVATFAFYRGNAWIVENQADHFWDPANAGPDADPPFRLVEIPLNL
jgi:hypothetical protein